MIHAAMLTPNVMDVTLDGLVTQDDIAALRGAFDGFLSADGPLGLVVDMTRFDDMTEDAVAVDVRFELSMLPRLHRFDRVALISDKRMLHALVGWLDRFVPGTEARAFPPAERAAALAFVQAVADEAPDPHAGLRMLPGGPDLVAYEITGTLGPKAADPVFARIESAAETGHKVDLMAVMTGFAWFDPHMLLDDDVYEGKLDALRTVRRYAIAGAPPGWAASPKSPPPPSPSRRVASKAKRVRELGWLEISDRVKRLQ
jgi:hypothetical protein